MSISNKQFINEFGVLNQQGIEKLIKNIDEKLDRLDKTDNNIGQAALAEIVTQKVIEDNENIEKRS